MTDPNPTNQSQTTLLEPGRSQAYESRWNQLKAGFVDEPRTAVHGADNLVGEVLDELQRVFREQRAELEQDLDDNASTEDLRRALGQYRGMIDRLLAV